MAVPLIPRTVVPDRLQGALGWYRVAAYITGILLILLSVEMVAKYGYGLELEMNGGQGFLAFVPDGTVQAINLSSLILIVHGWFYVAGLAEAKVEAFYRHCVTLGADRATFTRSQFVRMPDGLRDNGVRQGVYYFDPAIIEAGGAA